MEKSFKKEIGLLSLGEGQTFHGEGILAITKALLQSGVAYVGGYQGAPVSHLIDVMVQAEEYLDTLGVHVEACSNEASAAAMLGASIHYPLRGAVTWKSIVGTNVAADALSNLSSPGVTGGALIVVGEDYGEGASVIQERTHAYALKSSMLMLDPRPDLPAMVRMVEEGFRLSEASNMPALLELRIRACHVRGSFVCKDNVAPAISTRHLMEEPAKFDYTRLAHPPVTFRHEKLKVEARIPAARRYIAEHRLNELLPGKRGDVGFIVQGGLYNSLIRALQQFGLADAFGEAEIPILVLNVTFPLVPEQIAQFCLGKRAVLILEEGTPEYIEQEILASLRRLDINTPIHGKDMLTAAGEYTVEVIAGGLEKFTDRYLPGGAAEAGRGWLHSNATRRQEIAKQLPVPLPARPPQFCVGCPERPVFAALKLSQRDVGSTHIAGDIGCHSFATFEPFSFGHSILGYGMSLASRAGVSPMMKRRVLSVMGDGGVLAQRAAHRRAVGAVQRRRRSAGDIQERLHLGHRHAGTDFDAGRRRQGRRAGQAAEPGPPQPHHREDADRHGRAMDAHRAYLSCRKNAQDFRRSLHFGFQRPQGHHRRRRVPARTPAAHQAVDCRVAESREARGARQVRRRRGCLHG